MYLFIYGHIQHVSCSKKKKNVFLVHQVPVEKLNPTLKLSESAAENHWHTSLSNVCSFLKNSKPPNVFRTASCNCSVR